MNENEVKKLYTALIDKGFSANDIGDENTFVAKMGDPNSRKQFYDAISKTSFKIGDYDTFEKRLTSSVQVEQPASTPDSPLSKEERAGYLMQGILGKSNTSGIVDDFSAFADNMREYGDKAPVSQNMEQPIESSRMFNPESGKMEKTFVTPSGSRYNNKNLADFEVSRYREAADMTVNGQLRRARAKLEELQAKKADRTSEVHDEAMEFNESKLTGLGQMLVGGDIYVAKQRGDSQKGALDVAIRQTEELIKDLEEQKDRDKGVDVGFWRGVGRTMGDSRTWDLGIGNMGDAITMLHSDKLADENATEGEKDAYNEMMSAIYNKEQADRKYGDNRDFWYKAGVTTGYMPSFMIDFIATGGGFKGLNLLSKGGAKAATKIVGKEISEEIAEKGFKQFVKDNGVKGFMQYGTDWTVKALGTMGDDLLVRAPMMANTVQFGKTASDIIDRKLGDVVVNEDGSYDFANDKTWSSAIWQGEANAIVENYSEMFGGHLGQVVDLGKLGKLANVIGAKRLGNILTQADAGSLGGIMGQTQRLFNEMGVGDYFGEVTEEFYGQLWRTVLNLDDAYIQNPDGTRTNLFATSEFYGDVLGGMAISMGLMGAAKTIYTGARYASAKHNVNKADKRAAVLFGDEWEGIRATIDNTTNDNMGTLIQSVLAENYSTKEMNAILSYMESSMVLRGFNLGTLARSRGEQNEIAQQVNESYLDGYNASTPQEMNNAQNMYDLQREKALLFFTETELETIANNPVAHIDAYSGEHRDVLLDYINAKQVRDGMIQRVRDDIDSRIEESNTMVDSRTNTDTGMIQGATMKVDDRKVYVVKGNLVQYDDKSGINNSASSESVIIRDAQTGKIEIVSPDAILNIDDAIDPNEEKATAAEVIRTTYAQAEADKMEGKLTFNPGDTYTLDTENGQMQVQIIANEQGIVDNGDGTINVTDGQNIFPVTKQTFQDQVDAANKARVAQYDALQQAERSMENAPEYALNDKVVLRDANGNTINGQIAEVFADDGYYIVDVDVPINGSYAARMTRDELNNMLVEHNGVNVNTPSVPAQQAQSTPVAPTPSQQAQTLAAPQSNTALSRIPTDAQGNPIYEQTDADTAWDAIVEQTEGDEAMAQSVAESMLKDKQTSLSKAEKMQVKGGATIAEKIAAEKERKAIIANAQREVELWQQIAGTVQRRQAAAEVQRKIEEEKRRIAEEAAAQQAKVEEEQPQVKQEENIFDPLMMSEDEKKKRGEMLQNAPIIDVEEHQIIATKEISARKAAEKWWDENISTPIFYNTEVGEVEINRTSVESSLAHRYSQTKLDAITSLVVGFENAVYLGTLPDSRERGVIDHYFAYPINYKGERHYVFCRAMQDANKNRLYVHEVFIADKIKKGDTLQTAASKPHGGISLYRDILANVLETVKNTSVSDTKDTTNLPNSNNLGEKITEAEAEVNTNPTEAQKEAGNYKKGHVQIGTFNVTIEQPKGSVRSGVDKGGKKWEVEMQNTYGYIRGTEGVDGDHIDVFLSDNIDGWDGRQVYVIDQRNADGSFDEHKVMLGFNDINDAEAAYLSNYEDGWQGLGVITGVSIEDFEKWIDSSHRKTKAFAEYKSINPTEAQAPTSQVTEQVEIEETPTISQESEQDNAQYAISPTQYTTKRGNVLDMFLVKFANPLSKEQQKKAKELAKSEKGWYDREQGGFMMRNEESAKQLADTILNNNTVSDTQPVSMSDIQAVNNGDVSFTEPQKPKTPDSPIWQYSVYVDADGYTTISRDDVSGVTPIGDGLFRFSADSPEEMLDILRNPHNGMQEVLDAIGVTLENKIATRKLNEKIKEERRREYEALRTNGYNGFKIGDEVFYKGKKAKLHDFEEFGKHRPILDTGLAPVIYEVAEWSEIAREQQSAPVATEDKAANSNKSSNRLVTDERYAELRERMRKKLGGQMNIGIDPEILAIGTEMAVYHLEKGARKFAEYAKAMIADLGDAIRPYLKAFYNGARNLPEVESSEIAADMTSYDEVQKFDVANFDKKTVDAIATAETVAREQEVEQEVEIAQDRIKKARAVLQNEKNSVNLEQNQLELSSNERNEQNAATDNSGTQFGREELSNPQQMGTGASAQNSGRNSNSERRRPGISSGESGNGSQYDVDKNYTNEEINEIVSSVTDIVDGKVVITKEVSDDIKTIARQYKSGGVSKKGRGILDEYYTDGKIVDAVNMLIAPYFNNSKAIRVLEPSVGVGNFLSAINNIPTSEVVAFEINETTARIAKVLYPNTEVNLRSFETEFIDDSGKKKPLPKKFTLVIGNPPYGSHRGLYKGLGEESKIARYEDYFVKRSLDILEEGGVLAMVLPSSWIDRHTEFGGYSIEAAYRLPSGAFEATQVGTDIVVLKKDSTIPVSEHIPYFEQYPERILGEVKQRKGRFGKMEQYVDGDIDAALETIRRDHAIELAQQLNIEQNNDNLNDIEAAIEETGSAQKAKTIVEAEKSDSKETDSESKTPTKQSKYKVKLSRGVETVPTSLQFKNKFNEGETEAFADTDYDGAISSINKHSKYVNYINGQAIHDFYYAEGDIYSKLEQLELEKDYIVENYGIEQYQKQKQLLESVLPKRKGLNEISISPNTTFVKNLNIVTNSGSKTLAEMFKEFCHSLPHNAFGASSSWEVISYVNNEQVYGQDKERNALIRERRKRVANDLFEKFLNEELSDSIKGQVVAAFNREYNSTYRPDYSKVPMFSTINKDFKGKPLRLTEVQLAGIGRMTVKGVGVLAHEVGFGKTLSGILAMHEAMTRGFAEKPLIVVPNNNILEQWVETINEVIPNATINILGNLGTSYDLSDFKINSGEFTIVTYEGLKAMSFSDDTYNRLAERFSYITEDLEKHQSERDLQKEIEKKNELKGKMKRGAKPTYLFEDFGFDWLTVDEVHNANHIVSKVRLDKSVASDFRSQSQRTSDLGIKTWLASQYIQDQNNGRNVLLLSATPFTNKPLEYYSILSLVANDMLRSKGFFNVDQFFTTFMEADNELEVGTNGRPVQKTNIRRFKNNGLFQQLLSEFIDIKGEEDNPDLVRPVRQNKEYRIAQNELTMDAIAAVQELLNDNETVLQGIGHARAAAFSPYATSLMGIQPKDHKEFVKNSPKIDTAIRLIEQNKKDRPDAGQIIYSEVGVEFFPLIRDYLVKESGFKPNEVRIITGATSNNERVKIQTEFNKGEVKIVIGSPAIKEGLNLQENTTDMYILSLPWNFTQLRQIEGRGWRQGNKWENIRINYMLTNDSVDVFMLQRLQLKQGLYNEAMKSGAESLDVSDIDTSELKTALITDPAVRAEFVTVQERERLKHEIVQIEADLSFVMRKYDSYNKLLDKLKSQRDSIRLFREWSQNRADSEYWKQRVESEENKLKKIESEIEQEKENLLKKGVNIDDIVRQTEQSQNAIAAIQEKIDNLKEYQEDLTNKFRQEDEEKAKQQGDMLSTYLDERKSENRNGFYKIRPKQEEQQIKKEDDDTLYRSDDDVLRLNKYAVEEIFGGIWIEDKEEFAKFASAVNNSPFEENGEGVAYTDNYFYAYYLNIDGQVIPFASVYLNSLESQEVVNQVKQEIKNGRKKEGIKQYFDRAFIRARSLRSQDNADNGDNNGLSSPTNDGRLDAGLLRKGRYYDRPSLYVKTQRVDRFGLIEDYSRQGEDAHSISARQRSDMVNRIQFLAEKLNIRNLEIVTDISALEGNRKKSKGFFSKKTGKITIVLPNHSSIFDVEQTLLHEAVAHYGLRNLFGENFDTFLDNVFNNAEKAIREKIVALAAKNGWDFRKATEEYLAGLAENTNFEEAKQSGWWSKIKEFFLNMLHKIGFADFNGATLTDNELRYILWRSYENLVEPGANRSLFGTAEDIAKQYELGVGDYAEEDGDTLFRTYSSIRDRYDRAVRVPNKSGSVKWHENSLRRLKEAYYDNMHALKKLQDLIAEETGKPIQSYENSYEAENHMSSENKAQAEIFERDFFNPLKKVVQSLIKLGSSYEKLKTYIIAKHGLERNAYMRNKAVQNGENGDRDFSGLTDLTGIKDVADAEIEAQRIVDEYEKKYDTTELWEKINAATKETLRKSYDSGLISKETYEEVRDMYKYYIPLRGWDIDVASDEYEYLNSGRIMLSPALNKAKGRTSLADDPLATIGFMAESTIIQGNRNKVKMKFLNMALNHPTDLISVSEQWYVLDNATGEWEPRNPIIPDGATGDQVAAIVEQHEQQMIALGDKATKIKDGLKLNKNITKREGQEHVVRVKRNGKEYCLYINGSPRAAQAINGLLNPDINNSGLKKVANAIKHWMAAMFTSKNPTFIFLNLSRDVIWAGTSVAIKENAAYNARYTKNIAECLLKAQLPRLLKKFQNGTLDMNNELERYFDEFIRNGGETGFTQLHGVDDYKRNINRFVKEAQGKGFIVKKTWDGMIDNIEFMNRCAEDTTRFMVYMTSRQMGRDVMTSVTDAKEITVNFNRKGSGGLGASLFNFCYLFFNASIQSAANFGKLLVKHPKKSAIALTLFSSAGFLVPMLNMAIKAMFSDDEDDNSYWDLPEWIRRNNIVLYVPWTESGYLTIPVPHELRPFYGMGEIAFSCLMGKEDVEDGLKKASLGFTQLIPLDFTGNGGNFWVNITPTIASPIAQIITNKDYFGKPIYKKNDWNERSPEWTKAYKSTTPWLIDATKWLNEISGGDNVKKGKIDLNPALIEHIFESYTGGAGKTLNNAQKTFAMLWNEDLREWRNVPIIGSFYRTTEEQTAGSQINREYYEAVEEMKDVQHLVNGYKREFRMGNLEYAEKINELINSEIFKRYGVIYEFSNAIKEASDYLKLIDDTTDREKIETGIMNLKVNMFKKLEEINKAEELKNAEIAEEGNDDRK